ncbi:MAG TPA: hypothetical protein PLF16_01330 [Candidatus Staskawiczbacteria bacterium]|nr:hypothetical protein [Candidatus Staskawiczbacteria bacterium]
MDTILEEKILDLALSRAIKTAYAELSVEKQKEMQEIFSQATSNQDKQKFFEKNITNFNKIFEQETQKLQQEIFEEIKKRV